MVIVEAVSRRRRHYSAHTLSTHDVYSGGWDVGIRIEAKDSTSSTLAVLQKLYCNSEILDAPKAIWKHIGTASVPRNRTSVPQEQIQCLSRDLITKLLAPHTFTHSLNCLPLKTTKTFPWALVWLTFGMFSWAQRRLTLCGPVLSWLVCSAVCVCVVCLYVLFEKEFKVFRPSAVSSHY